MIKKTEMIIVRHGETAWNIEGRCQGQLDSPLTANGITQLQHLSNILSRFHLSAVYSSDLTRAYQSASTIASRIGLSIIKEPRLRERNFGIFQGLKHEEIKKRFSFESQLKPDDPDYIVPQGESLDQFRNRIIACLNDLAARHTSRRFLVMSHGGVIIHFMRYVLGIPVDTPRRFSVANAALNLFSFENDEWRMDKWGIT